MSDRPKELLSMYQTMVKIRQFETMASEYFAAGEIPGFIHLSIGQEAPVVRVAAKDVPIPFSPPLEDYVLPRVSDIIDAAKAVLYR